MTNKIADLLGTARKLESALATSVEGATRLVTGSSASPRHPLELVLAVVDAIEREIQPAGRGKRAFPFTHIQLQLLASSPRTKAHLEVACEGPPTLRARILERLEAAGCTVSALAVDIAFATTAEPDWSHGDFDIQCARSAGVTPPPRPPARLELTVAHGTADRIVYVFEGAPIALGRGDEVRDERQRLIRTNQVAFTEGAGEINQSVSRRHARIEHDVAPDAYRLYDDGSAQGTSVIRRGRGFPVPRGTKGLRLQSGDEIVLGQARLQVKI
jgi:FHA domain